MMDLAWFALAGLAAGFLSGLLGIGGGLVLVPVLHHLLSRDPATAPLAMHLAVATSLATMLFTSAASVWAHHRKEAVRWDVFRGMLPGLALGAILGAVLAHLADGGALARVFGIYALLVGLQLVIARQPGAHGRMPGVLATHAASGVIGTVSSMVGIGGGSMTVPWLLWHGVRPAVAVATSAACGYPIAVAGTVAFVVLGREAAEGLGWSGYVHAPAFAGIVLFSLVAAPVGAAVVHRMPAAAVRRVFGFFLLVVAVRMLW